MERETPHTLAKREGLCVLLVTPRYLPYMGGVENHVHQVAQRLARAGVNVTILTTDPSGQLPVEESSEGVTVQRVRAWPGKRDYYFAPNIYRVITQGDWDIIHIQSYHTLVAPLAMLAALRAGIPYVVTFHGGGHSSRLRNALRGVQRILLRPLLARAARLVAVASFEVAFFGKQLRLGDERFVLIPNGADLPKVHHLAPAIADPKIIASVGRLERYKGHHRIIAALPKVLEQQPDVHLWIAGSGPYEPVLLRLAHELGVTEHVEIRAIPADDRQRMAVELSKVALVMLLSEYETHPIAVLEALAVGRPVLVADTSGLAELAERGLAQAIPVDSTAEQVAMAILAQLRQPHVPSKIEFPTWDDCAADLLHLYYTITGSSECVS